MCLCPSQSPFLVTMESRSLLPTLILVIIFAQHALGLKYAAEVSELKTDLEDLTHNLMKMSLFANIVFGIICVALLSLFLFEIKEQSTNSEVSRGQDHSETSTQSQLF